MLQFIFIIAIILLVSVYLLLLPLLRKHSSASYSRDEQNIYFAQQRLNELEQQLKTSNISTADYKTLKLEIEQTLANELEQTNQQTKPEKSGKKTAFVIATFIPIAAICVYLIIGNPGAINYQQQIENLKEPENLAALLETIENRLQQQPNDKKGWSVLANTYMATGQFKKAQNAYRNLLKLTGDDALILTRLADAIAMANKGKLSGEAEQLLEKALQLNPNSAETLWLAGMAALQNKKPAQAIVHWQNLLPLFADMPAQQQELQALIAQANNMLNGASAQNANQAISGKSITVEISIDSSIQSEVQDSDTVFVIAKAVGDNAPKAPLAVKRLTAGDLPTTITLSDADAMMPQLSISKFEDIAVTARISKTGNPIAQAGDFQSTEQSANPSSTAKLLINLKRK